MRATLRRGSLLVAALLLSTVMLIMGGTLLAVNSRGYSASRAEIDGSQARLLARAGVSDAMLKLSKDVDFPPRLSGRRTFGYSEVVYDPETVTGSSPRRIGTYVVSLDVSRAGPSTDGLDRGSAATYDYPAFAVIISSRGVVERTDASVTAQCRVLVEVDVSPKRRGAPVSGLEPDLPASITTQSRQDQYYTNEGFLRVIRWEDAACW